MLCMWIIYFLYISFVCFLRHKETCKTCEARLENGENSIDTSNLPLVEGPSEEVEQLVMNEFIYPSPAVCRCCQCAAASALALSMYICNRQGHAE